MTDSHMNFDGGRSFDINNPLNKLRVVASSCFFGEPKYYQETVDPAKAKAVARRHGSVLSTTTATAHLDKLLGRMYRAPQFSGNVTSASVMETLIDAALDFDLAGTLNIAVQLRQEMHMRLTPQVIMVRAANHPKISGNPVLGKVGNKIMNRLDEVMVQAEYHLKTYGKKIPSRLKRAWARRLELADEYQLAKYRREKHDVNIYDIVNLVHPASDAISKLMKGQVKLGGENETWESVRAAGGSWEKAAEEMGHMALLRNMRNLDTAGLADKYTAKLIEGVPKGRQLPFRYYTAYQNLPAGSAARKATEKCIDLACDNLPHFEGTVACLTDNSGSAQSATISGESTVKVSTIGNLMGTITARRSDKGYVGVFGDRLEMREIDKRKGTLEQLEELETIGRGIGHGTENGIWLFFDEAIRSKTVWDHIFVYSDMQAGHGGLYGNDPNAYKDFIFPNSGKMIDVPALINKYRAEVNSKVMVYLIQTAGYQDSLVPEFYDRTFILGGWSDKVLHFASEMNNLFA